MSARRWSAGLRGVALLAGLALAACDSGPEGPGVLNAKVIASQPLGAVVLEFTGTGVRGFEGQGATQVYAVAGAAGAARQRVILVSPSGGTEIAFGIDLEDRGAEMPAVVAVMAATPANAPVTTAGVKVRIER